MLLIYVFTQWLAAIAMVVANVEMRFLWLGLATAILVGTVVVIQRQRSNDRDPEAELSASDSSVPEDCSQSCCSDPHG